MQFEPSALSVLPGDATSPPATSESRPRERSTASRVFTAVHAVAVPLAAAISYKRNKSLVWAALSGIVAFPYLTYVLVVDKAFAEKERE